MPISWAAISREASLTFARCCFVPLQSSTRRRHRTSIFARHRRHREALYTECAAFTPQPQRLRACENSCECQVRRILAIARSQFTVSNLPTIALHLTESGRYFLLEEKS